MFTFLRNILTHLQNCLNYLLILRLNQLYLIHNLLNLMHVPFHSYNNKNQNRIKNIIKSFESTLRTSCISSCKGTPLLKGADHFKLHTSTLPLNSNKTSHLCCLFAFNTVPTTLEYTRLLIFGFGFATNGPRLSQILHPTNICFGFVINFWGCYYL